MKKLSTFTLLIMLFSGMAFSSNSSPRPSLYLILDYGLTMRSGAENIFSVQKGFSLLEDRIIGTNWFRENNFLGKAGGLLLRYAKYLLLDQPVDYFSVVLAHEYFGHGARYRELGIHEVKYGFDMPPPYGVGGGEASINISGDRISTHELLAIWHGGMDIHSLLNRKLSIHWVANKDIHYREASLYWWSWQIMFKYIQTEEDLTLPRNDPRAYVEIINRLAGRTDFDNLLMDVAGLKSRSMINLANPFVLFSVYTILKTYLWDGNSTNGIPMFHIKGVDYLPSLRMGLTPFGPEYHLENYFRIKDRVFLADLRLGDQTFHKNWGGIGLFIQDIYRNRMFSLDLNLNIWKQPEIGLECTPAVYKGGGVGGALSFRFHHDFALLDSPVTAVFELGYKSPGFLEGYALDSSVFFMVGLGIRN